MELHGSHSISGDIVEATTLLFCSITCCCCCWCGAWQFAHATGKVCIIPRGDITFCEKATMCAAAGGVAAIIYNNVAGPFRGTLSGSCPGGKGIPSFTLPQDLAPKVQGPATITGTPGSPYPYAFYDG
jgi:hypothetical protein